jgi:hypothetical protein
VLVKEIVIKIHRENYVQYKLVLAARMQGKPHNMQENEKFSKFEHIGTTVIN